MADETVTTATPAPAAPVQTSTLEGILAAAEAKAEGVTVDTPTQGVKPTIPATIDIDPATLKQLTTLQKKNRELTEQLKKQAPADADTANAVEAAKLFKEGKRLEAIAKLTGKDPDSELTALLETYIQTPTDEGENELAKKVDEIAKAVEADKAAREEEKKARAIEDDKRAQATALQFSARQLDATKFELCAKEENKAEAAQAALDGVVYLAGRRKIDLAAITEAETAALFAEAYEGVEAQYDALGKRYARAAKAQTEERPWTPPPARGAPPAPVPNPPRAVSSIDDIIARAEERARAS